MTRSPRQAGKLSEALAQAGAVPIAVPTIDLAEPDDSGDALRAALFSMTTGRYAWVVFTSENTVERVFQEVADSRAFGSVKVAAIGEGTASSLREHGISPDLVPETFVAEALADAFPPAASTPAASPAAEPGRERVLLPRAAVARDVLERRLGEKGYDVDVVTAYRTVRPDLDPTSADLSQQVDQLDAVTFTASSTVTGWVEMFGAERVPPVVACIGPITARTARDAGMDVAVEAGEHSIPGLVRALEEYAAANGRRPPSHQP